MCRFALYLGDEVPLSRLVTEPVNSIIHQSFHANLREEPLNGDGFGVAWYPSHEHDGARPAVFRSVTPAWSNHNLTEISRVTRSTCILAHVRAATRGLPVSELNCHPFVWGSYAFMHNGHVGGFAALRRRLLAELSDEAFQSIAGSTDTEHVFALFRDRLAESAPPYSVARIARGLEATIRQVEALRRELVPEQDALLNLAVCDGHSAVVTRYASPGVHANSLFVAAGRMHLCEDGTCRVDATEELPTAVVVASEPLNEGGSWVEVPPNHVVTVDPGRRVDVRAIEG